MKNENECNVIKDLLPSYIDNLTSIESNKLINKHLEECNNCKEFLNNIKNEEVNEEKEIEFLKFAKKYNKKLFNLKMILIFIILIGLSVFTVSTGRKMIIISNLSNKAKEYENSTNYHWITYGFEEGTFSKQECYKMGDKVKTAGIYITDNGIEKSICFGSKNIERSKESPDYDVYDMNDYYDIYQSTELPEIKDKKIAVIDSELSIGNMIPNVLYTDNLWELFKCAVKSSIKSDKMYEKECYYITNFDKYSAEGMYVDKKTGMPVKYSPSKTGIEGDWKTCRIIRRNI